VDKTEICGIRACGRKAKGVLTGRKMQATDSVSLTRISIRHD
jgi:hypothetical protein